jgi:hypothetical protein
MLRGFQRSLSDSIGAGRFAARQSDYRDYNWKSERDAADSAADHLSLLRLTYCEMTLSKQLKSSTK